MKVIPKIYQSPSIITGEQSALPEAELEKHDFLQYLLSGRGLKDEPRTNLQRCLCLSENGDNEDEGAAIYHGYDARPAVVSHCSAPRRPYGRALFEVVEGGEVAPTIYADVIGNSTFPQMIPSLSLSAKSEQPMRVEVPFVSYHTKPPLASPEAARLTPAHNASGPLLPPLARAGVSNLNLPSARATTVEIIQSEFHERELSGAEKVNDSPTKANNEITKNFLLGSRDKEWDSFPLSKQEEIKPQREFEKPEVYDLKRKGEEKVLSENHISMAEMWSREKSGIRLQTVEEQFNQIVKLNDGKTLQAEPSSKIFAETSEADNYNYEESKTSFVKRELSNHHADEFSERIIQQAGKGKESSARRGSAGEKGAPTSEFVGTRKIIEAAGLHINANSQLKRNIELREAVPRRISGLEAPTLLPQLENAARRAIKLSRVLVHLRPPELGTIRIAVEAREGNLSARFAASNPTVAAWLETNIGTLRANLSEAGLSFSEVNCSLTSDQQTRDWTDERPERPWLLLEEEKLLAVRVARSMTIEQRGLADWLA